MGDRPEIQQGNIFNDRSQGHFYGPVTQNFGPQPPQPTGDGPPTNLQDRGVDRDRFFGRDEVLAELHDRLGRSDRVAVTSVAGMGGVGKSELAVQYARWRLQEGDYRGGVVWLAGERAGIELLGFAKAQFFPDVDLAQLGDLREQLTFRELQVDNVMAEWGESLFSLAMTMHCPHCDSQNIIKSGLVKGR
ncbi:MAG: hypothetical protein BJG00_006040, partial [Limnothrix sp. CACIAM 69d]